MKSHFFTRNFVCLLILFSIAMSCQKDQSQLVSDPKTISLEEVKELYSKQKVFSKINPKDNLPVQWEPLWDNATIKKTNDSTEYLFIPLHPYLKSDKKQKSEERGAKTYLLVKNGSEFYTGVYYGNSKEEIVDIRTFTGKMLFTNLENRSANLIKYRNGSPYFDGFANIQKKGASSTKMGWEQQNCRTEIKDCAFRLLDYSCMGQLIVVRSMDCSYPGFCTQFYWDMIDSNEVTVCDNVWVPDAPDGGDGGSGSGVTSFNIIASGPKIDPKKENKCFNTSQSAELTIYVQQANEGSRDLVGSNEVGHVFVGIKQGGIERYYGFYPTTGANSAMVAVGKDYSSELRDNSGEMYHVSITKSITSSQLNSVITYANTPPQTYNVNSYACTDFGIAIGKLGGINLPSTKETSMMFNGTSPGNLGEDIRSGNFPNTTKKTSKSNAPAKKGSCP